MIPVIQEMSEELNTSLTSLRREMEELADYTDLTTALATLLQELANTAVQMEEQDNTAEVDAMATRLALLETTLKEVQEGVQEGDGEEMVRQLTATVNQLQKRVRGQQKMPQLQQQILQLRGRIELLEQSAGLEDI